SRAAPQQEPPCCTSGRQQETAPCTPKPPSSSRIPTKGTISMPKITMIGAGSTVFAKNLLGDILSFPELADSHIALMDIDNERLKTSEIVAHKVAQAVGAKPKITTHTDRRAALDGADYAIHMFKLGGHQP